MIINNNRDKPRKKTIIPVMGKEMSKNRIIRNKMREKKII